VEEISKIYLDELRKASNPGVVLAKMYCELYTISDLGKFIKIFNRLLKLYGRENIFLSILDTYDVTDFKSDNPYALLTYFMKKRLEDRVNIISRIDVEELEFQLNAARHNLKDLVLKDPFEETDANQTI
jgi:hypothetical protein